jgi:hypothetical protein
LGGDKIDIDLTKEKTPYPAISKSQQIGSVVPTNVAQTAIKTGGVTIHEIMSKDLTQAGQMICSEGD